MSPTNVIDGTVTNVIDGTVANVIDGHCSLTKLLITRLMGAVLIMTLKHIKCSQEFYRLSSEAMTHS